MSESSSDQTMSVLKTRVRFAETDMQGTVHYGMFFTYQDEAFSEFLRRIDYPYSRMHENGWTTYIKHANLDYHAPAKYGDVIANGLRIARFGSSSITAKYTAHRNRDDELLAEGSVVHVAVSQGDDIPTRVPQDFRGAVADFQTEPPRTD